MRISSIFTAVITALAAASFAATDPAPQTTSRTAPAVGTPHHASPTSTLLAAIDPLAITRYAIEADYR